MAAIDAQLRGSGCRRSRPRPTSCPRRASRWQWVPQTRGTPDIPANMPRAYWPGGEYVDWVGTDFYSRFPNFHWLDDFYRDFPGKPFVFGEWALWGADDPGFVNRLFGWIGEPPARADGGLQPGRADRRRRSGCAGIRARRPRCARRSRTVASRQTLVGCGRACTRPSSRGAS